MTLLLLQIKLELIKLKIKIERFFVYVWIRGFVNHVYKLAQRLSDSWENCCDKISWFWPWLLWQNKHKIKLKLTGERHFISISDIKISRLFAKTTLIACLILKMTSFGEEEDSNMVSSSGSSPALGNDQDPEVLEVLSTSPNSSSSR